MPDGNIVSDAYFIQAYFTLFDEVLFGGSLKSHTKVRHHHRDDDQLLRDITIKSVSCVDGNILSTIIVHRLSHGEIRMFSRYNRLLIYLSNLLHEMIRVFLKTFGCRHPRCLHEVDGMTNLGISEAWQHTAFVFESWVDRYLGLKLDLLRKWGWVVELRHSGLTAGELRTQAWKFGFDPIEIREKVRTFHHWSGMDGRSTKGFIEWAMEQAEKERLMRARAAPSQPQRAVTYAPERSTLPPPTDSSPRSRSRSAFQRFIRNTT
ncbi:hypothetical protein BJ878DRAFT_515772 [Calycina marina]|uniref:Uncharacterized protein n=1 Tax=Calycina marina TaxID=1763456 RepID=A0A9P7Z039_9HELO|nr:hypothetical protein BJ878DRAFT_515772 [Calycina marina]